ncbi:hypothetical protein D3C86_2145090 [compost metagenome]
MAVLERQAPCRVNAEPFGGEQVGLGVGLGIDHVVTRHHGVEQVEQAGRLQMVRGMGIA